MKHLGDITKINGYEAPVVDCVIGGSPCQDLSQAGLRKGLAGARSGLYMDQIRIIKEMRERDKQSGRTGVDIRPRYMVWENVPGAFSTNNGQDFAAVLEEAIRVAEPEAPSVPVSEKGWPTAGCIVGECWSIAWRVLDAQFWGTSDKPLPQRRRRIALVADFGGLSAPEILFVKSCVSGNIEPGEPKRKTTPGNARAGSGGAVGCDIYGLALTGDKASTLTTQSNAAGSGPRVITSYAIQGSMIGRQDKNGPQGDGVNEDVSFTLNATDRHGVDYGISPYHSNCMKSDNPHSGIYEAETARTLDALNCGYPGCNQGGMAVVQPVIAVDQGGGKSGANSYENISPTLTCTHGGEPAVAYSIENHPADSRVDIDPTGKVQTLTSRMGTGGGNVPMVMESVTFERQAFGKYKDSGIASSLKARDLVVNSPIAIDRAFFNQGQNALYEPQYYEDGTVPTLVAKGHAAVQIKHIVRRLTPLECERLQGFPDGWTDIGEWVDSKGKKHKEADSPRYKALGNSIALPPWKWVLKRLCACYERDATMASLFDGIGGFPLIWEQLNGKGSCLWASEIEEFPMAVTKVRFGE